MLHCGQEVADDPLDPGRAIDAGASDLMMLDVMKVGGVSGWMRAAAIAEAPTGGTR